MHGTASTCLWCLVKFKTNQELWGGVVVLGKLPVLGRPTNLEKSRTRA